MTYVQIPKFVFSVKIVDPCRIFQAFWKKLKININNDQEPLNMNKLQARIIILYPYNIISVQIHKIGFNRNGHTNTNTDTKTTISYIYILYTNTKECWYDTYTYTDTKLISNQYQLNV